MIQGDVLCFTNGGGAEGIQQLHPCNFYNGVLETSFSAGVESMHHTQSVRSLLFSLSILKEKVQDVESFVSNLVTEENQSYHHAHSTADHLTTSMVLSSMANMIQEIVQTASMMMLSCEQMALGPTHVQIGNTNNINSNNLHVNYELNTMQKANYYDKHAQFSEDEVLIKSNYNNSQEFLVGNDFNNHQAINKDRCQELEMSKEDNYDLVEVDAADLLAKYTHYCEVCGRGFKREANLRMHMRAHGDKYKSSLMSDPLKKKNNNNNTTTKPPRKYSCPHKGCRWNKNHVKFQPLKSMVCVRNHYKRSHCPKMFVCNRCNTKEFSVLSDLKTHEKHCGEIKWCCSCGTTFSKKDKLMDHVALFVGHEPLN